MLYAKTRWLKSVILTVLTQALETILIQNNPIYKSSKVLSGKQQ